MKIFNKPDLNSPRYRTKRFDLLTKSFYDEYRKLYPDTTLTDKEIKKIVHDFNGVLRQTVIDQRDGIELLESLGHLFIGTCQRAKNPNPDFVKSGELGRMVKHKNFDSDEYLCKIFYTNYQAGAGFRFRRLWWFKAGKQFRTATAKSFRKSWTRYVKVDDFTRISELFRIEKHRDFKKKKAEELIKNYNEFDLD